MTKNVQSYEKINGRVDGVDFKGEFGPRSIAKSVKKMSKMSKKDMPQFLDFRPGIESGQKKVCFPSAESMATLKSENCGRVFFLHRLLDTHFCRPQRAALCWLWAAITPVKKLPRPKTTTFLESSGHNHYRTKLAFFRPFFWENHYIDLFWLYIWTILTIYIWTPPKCYTWLESCGSQLSHV